jgi:phage baseplate assembly protein W
MDIEQVVNGLIEELEEVRKAVSRYEARCRKNLSYQVKSAEERATINEKLDKILELRER